MAKKVLISFLGTGQLEKNTSTRQYRKTLYRFADGKECSSAFFAAALREVYSFDKVILIGTTHSMWEEAYSAFVNPEERDDDYYVDLGEYCAQSGSSTELTLPNIEKLEKAIGPDAKVILTHYGITQQENDRNQEIILGLEEFLNKGDELYIDITHAFRSLPLLLLNTLIYLQTVSRKKIKIAHIFYGMFNTELGYAPVINLDAILHTTEWITGAYAFKTYGSAYKVADLLAETNMDMSNRLKSFSDLMSLNHLYGIKHQTNLQGLRSKTGYPSKTAEMLVAPIVEEFCQKFDSRLQAYEFQLKLAEWHRKHHNYSSAILVLLESMVSYICFLNGWDPESKDNRDEIKKVFKDKVKARESLNQQASDACMELKKIYGKINPIRNSIAHSRNNSKGPGEMIRILESSLKEYKSYLNSI